MATLNKTFQLSCPAETAFDFIADAMNETKWNPELKSIEKVTPGPVGLGTTFRGEYAAIGKLDFSIIEYRKPSVVNFKGGNRKLDLFADFSFRDATGGCEMEVTIGIEPKGFMKIIGPMLQGQMEKGMRVREEALRKALERG
jgi:hypothetical protein